MKLKPATIAARAAGQVGLDGAAIAPGIEMTSTFLRDAGNVPVTDKTYARDQNVTIQAVEEVLRQLEGAAETRVFPSGMAAVAAVMRCVPTGGRIILQSGIYWNATKFARGFCERRGITLHEVDCADLAALQTACATPADLVWVETPSNPWIKITDLRAAAKAAHGAGAVLAVDGTAASPVLTQSLALGADISVHSATKVLNGHSDLVAGALSVADAELAIWAQIKEDRQSAGAILGPMEAWLLMRGLRTLPLRVERMCANAMQLAAYLADHRAVETVWYPGLSDHPGHALAMAQMCGGYGYLMSVLIKGDGARALEVLSKFQLIHRATSLGGVESLIEQRFTSEPWTGVPENLLRLSVGIEDAGDLQADWDHALG